MASSKKLTMPPQLSEYEKRRLRNIEDNKRVLALLNQDLKNFGINLSGEKLLEETKKAPVKRAAVKRKRDEKVSLSKLMLAQYSPPRTRASRKSKSLSSSTTTSPDGNNNDENGKPRLVVKFGFGGKKTVGELGSDEEGDFIELPKRRYSSAQIIDSRKAEEITEEDLQMVANVFGDKVYDSFSGSSCHQCRQKTLDQKTICRSGDCFGVRGQFCGPCLRIRYGEDAREALKNEDWSCPSCRGICNCSFCRKKAGRGCTGILIHLARGKGFDDVNSYLQSLQKLTTVPTNDESVSGDGIDEAKQKKVEDSDSDSSDDDDETKPESKKARVAALGDKNNNDPGEKQEVKFCIKEEPESDTETEMAEIEHRVWNGEEIKLEFEENHTHAEEEKRKVQQDENLCIKQEPENDVQQDENLCIKQEPENNGDGVESNHAKVEKSD